MTLSGNAPEPVRFSRLKRMDQSAEHYASGSFEETGAMRKGTALHSYMLGAKEKVVVYRDGVRNAKSGKYKEFLAANVGKHILIPSEVEHVEGMRDAIERHGHASDLLDDGVQEQRITWDIGGRACAGTPDVVKPMQGRKRLVELKTCDTSNPLWFPRKAERYSYNGQVDWYGFGLERCLQYAPGPVDEVFIVAVESSPPYPVVVYQVLPCMLRKGRERWRGWFDTLLECERTGRFPGYTESVVEWRDEGPDGLGLEWGIAAAE